jgi:hypothetical protein
MIRRTVLLAVPFAVLVAARAVHAQLDVDADTIGLWHLDDGMGLVAQDSVGADEALDFVLDRFPYDGSAGAELPVWTPAGCFDGALRFAQGDTSGDGSLARTSAGAPLTPLALTIELWLRTTSTVGELFRGNGVDLDLWLDFAGRVDFRVGGASGWSSSAITSVTVNDDAWHYVAATWDGAEMRVYVDGEVRASVDFDGAAAEIPYFYLGGRPSNTFFEGVLDEVRLSRVAREPSEIADTWSTLSVLCPEPEAAPLAAALALCLARRHRP